MFGVHLNDDYGKRDDGLMVGSVHPIQTLELLYTLLQTGYDQAIYFDTFPDSIGIDPVAECALNIDVVRRMLALIERLDHAEMKRLLDKQDVVQAQRLVQTLLLS